MVRRGTVLVLMAWLGACNSAWEIGDTDLAPDDSDPDGDGTDEIVDNCAGVSNRSQADEDADGVGDACDSCPLTANTDQSNDVDHDGVGDICDPHPLVAGDCLALFDSFTDPLAFAAGWHALGADLSAVTPGDGSIAVSAPAVSFLLAPLDDAGQPYAGIFGAQLAGRATLTSWDTAVVAASNAGPSITSGYSCAARGPYSAGGIPLLSAGADEDPFYTTSLSQPAYLDDIELRLVTSRDDGTADSICRAEYGLAIGGITLSSAQPVMALTAGEPGIRFEYVAAEVSAFALYRFGTGACADAVRR